MLWRNIYATHHALALIAPLNAKLWQVMLSPIKGLQVFIMILTQVVFLIVSVQIAISPSAFLSAEKYTQLIL
ncbi:hypothetical protein D3C87_1901620 [compost metagenome]